MGANGGHVMELESKCAGVEGFQLVIIVDKLEIIRK